MAKQILSRSLGGECNEHGLDGYWPRAIEAVWPKRGESNPSDICDINNLKAIWEKMPKPDRFIPAFFT
jgi:hypothetical protein